MTEIDARDYATDEHYCQHGNYTGSWAGPDYMCGWCEAGISAAEAAEIELDRRIRNDRRTLEQYDRLVASFDGRPYDARIADVLVRMALEPGNPWAAAWDRLADAGEVLP
jgi:hypothetical protein